MKKYIINQFILCGIIGWTLECFWTGLGSIITLNDATLPCQTSMWMFPIYGLAITIWPISKRIQRFPWYIRGILYMLCIFFIEFVSGSILSFFHFCPWNYSHVKHQLKGVIRLDFAPLWFIVGLIFEKVLTESHRLAQALQKEHL